MSVVRRLSERIRKSFRRRQRPIITRRADNVDARPVKKGFIRCKIALLDGSDLTVDVEKKALGQVLVKKVLLNLDLVEKDYFGLQFMDTKQVPHWLDPTKKVKKQVKIGPPYTLHFRVKFYAAEPQDLHEELTRYHFFMQIKQDILRGKMKPTFDQMVGLGAYAVQSELGDYDASLHIGNYVSEFRLMPDQTPQLEAAIERKHRQLLGLNPADCELNFLKIAKDLENYGVDLHTVEDKEGKEVQLGLCAKGVLLYKDNQKVAGNPWLQEANMKIVMELTGNSPKISNIAFHKKEFILAAEKPSGIEENRYVLTTARASKHLWKCAIEYHTFFRMTKAAEPVETRSSFLRFGSRFRYSGRTLYQANKDDSINARKSLQVRRTRSERYAQRSTIGYIRVGSNVWAKSFNGDYYRGQVTALSEKVYIKFENGDTIAHDRSDNEAVVFDMDPNPTEIEIGIKVIAHWSGLAAMLPGKVEKREGDKYFVLYDDGDKAYNRIQQIRILKPPLYFGPGSGSSRIQKRLSMKATSLMGDGRISSSGDDNLSPGLPDGRGISVSADVVPDRRVSGRSGASSVKSVKSDTSEVFFSKFDSLQGTEERPSRIEDRRGTNERERRQTNDRDRRPTGDRDRRPTGDRDRNPRNDRGTGSNYNRDANLNGHHNGYEDVGRDAHQTGEQRWYTHVGRTEVMEERRQAPGEERIDGPQDGGHRYKVVQKTTTTTRTYESSPNQRIRNGDRAQPAFVTEL